jgi:hypothetical protein
MAEDHLELIVKCTPTGSVQTVRAWLERRGLSVTPMKSGFLLSGSRGEIEKSLGVPLDVGDGPATLAVPPDLKEHVASILLPGPRSYHQ